MNALYCCSLLIHTKQFYVALVCRHIKVYWRVYCRPIYKNTIKGGSQTYSVTGELQTDKMVRTFMPLSFDLVTSRRQVVDRPILLQQLGWLLNSVGTLLEWLAARRSSQISSPYKIKQSTAAYQRRRCRIYLCLSVMRLTLHKSGVDLDPGRERVPLPDFGSTEKQLHSYLLLITTTNCCFPFRPAI